MSTRKLLQITLVGLGITRMLQTRGRPLRTTSTPTRSNGVRKSPEARVITTPMTMEDKRLPQLSQFPRPNSHRQVIEIPWRALMGVYPYVHLFNFLLFVFESWVQDRQPPVRAHGTSGPVVEAASYPTGTRPKALTRCPDPRP
jgi:hypothetical protein